jgi:hypothetical protein
MSNMLPGAVGEVSLTLWFLPKGVNVQRWGEQETSAERRRDDPFPLNT